MNGKDEMLVELSNERLQDEYNDRMFASMAHHLGEALRGANNSNNSTVERALLDMQSDIRIIREEMCKLTGRITVLEKLLFEVVERKPTNGTSYNSFKIGSDGSVVVEL